jgi:hypothetical protein
MIYFLEHTYGKTTEIKDQGLEAKHLEGSLDVVTHTNALIFRNIFDHRNSDFVLFFTSGNCTFPKIF